MCEGNNYDTVLTVVIIENRERREGGEKNHNVLTNTYLSSRNSTKKSVYLHASLTSSCQMLRGKERERERQKKTQTMLLSSSIETPSLGADNRSHAPNKGHSHST